MTREEARAILAKHRAYNVEPNGLIRVRDAEVLLTSQMLRVMKQSGNKGMQNPLAQLVSTP